jgi:hypothetical protein
MNRTSQLIAMCLAMFFWGITPSFSNIETVTPRKLTILLQVELTRVGCDPGVIDGRWGKKGRRALALFKRYANLRLPYKDVSSEVVEAVKQQRSRVCPKLAPVKVRKTAVPVKSKVNRKNGSEIYYFNNRTGAEYKTWAGCATGANMPWRCEKRIRVRTD